MVLRGGATGLQIDGGGGVFVQLSTPLCDIRSKEWVYAVVDSIVHHRSAPPTAKKCLLGMCGCLIKRVNWSVSSFLRTLSLQMQPHILGSTRPFPLKFGSRTAVASGDTFGDRPAHWQERQTNSSIVLRHFMPICSGHAHHLPIFGLQSDLCTGVAQIQITDEAFSSHWRLAEKLKKLRKYPLSTWAILAGRQNILNPVFGLQHLDQLLMRSISTTCF